MDPCRRDAFPQPGRDVARAGLRQEHAARRARTADAPPGQRRRADRAALYRVVDRDHPTLLVDEADDLFHRKPDLKHIVNAGWTRGTKIPRVVQGVVREFDPFCAKAIASRAWRCRTRLRAGALLWTSGPSGLMRRSRSFCLPTVPSFKNCGASLRGGAPIMRRRSPKRSRHCRPALIIVWPPIGSCCSRLPITPAVIGPSGHVRRPSSSHASRRSRVQGLGYSKSYACCGRSASIVRVLRRPQSCGELTADPDSEWREYKGRGPITRRQIARLLNNYKIYPRIHSSDRAGRPLTARLPVGGL